MAGPSSAELEAAGVALARDLEVKADDGRRFLADFYQPKQGTNLRGVLLIPNGGFDRHWLAKTAIALAARGRGVLAMDNTGQDRNVVRRPDGSIMVNLPSTSIVAPLMKDVRPAARFLLGRAGIAPGGVAIVGVGTGANLGLALAAETADVIALAMIFPGYGCDEFAPADLIGRLARRPAILVNSRKKKTSDIVKAFDASVADVGASMRDHLEIPLATRENDQDEFEAHEGLESTVLDWLDRTLSPPPAH